MAGGFPGPVNLHRECSHGPGIRFAGNYAQMVKKGVGCSCNYGEKEEEGEEGEEDMDHRSSDEESAHESDIDFIDDEDAISDEASAAYELASSSQSASSNWSSDNDFDLGPSVDVATSNERKVQSGCKRCLRKFTSALRSLVITDGSDLDNRRSEKSCSEFENN